jgi:predicted Rossmann-fold nucleotide-binding protein
MKEIERLEDFQKHITEHGSLENVVLQGLDLRAFEERLTALSFRGAVLLGCTLSTAEQVRALEHGALVFPALAGPYVAYRPALYTVDELMDGYRRGEHASFFTSTLDARIYAHYTKTREHVPVMEGLAQRIHDHAVDDALDELLRPHGATAARVVAFMGGHALSRTDGAFLDVARCAYRLANKGYLVTTGGGPGAMEAANLGACFARRTEQDLLDAVSALAKAPSYKTEGWFDVAYDVRERVDASDRGISLGIPTWFYGHEPTNLFCSHVAKYFSNALREDGLLAIARHGVVFARGGPGTLQEVFLDLCQNAYATYGDVSPMVFLGTRFWREERSFFPILEKMGQEAAATKNPWGAHLTCVDDVDEVVRFLETHPPTRPSR